jgi:hypothetical protein
MKLRDGRKESPFSLRETTAWMQEVGQRREQLPKARMRGVKSLREFAPLTPTLSLRERERQWWYCRLQAAQGFIGAFEALTQ